VVFFSNTEIDSDGESSSNDANSQRKFGNPLVCLMLRKVAKKKNAERKKKKNVTIEMLQPSRYKPSDLNQMAEQTKFTKSNFITLRNFIFFVITILKIILGKLLISFLNLLSFLVMLRVLSCVLQDEQVAVTK